MDRTKIIAALIAAAVLSGCGRSDAGRTVRVGSKNFTEQVVLGEIISTHLEKRLHIKVARSLNLGGTLLTHQALLNREIDVYPEYTGTALAAVLKDTMRGDAAGVLARVRSEYQRRFQVEWLDPLGINNGFVMVVRGPEARAQHLQRLSDAARVGTPWNLGAGYEFEQRADGLAALTAAYQLHWSGAPKSMDLGLLYQAIGQKQVDMIAANATDGLLSKQDLTVLEDDKHVFPPYEVCITARADSLRDIPGLRQALLELSGKFSNEKMQRLNYQADVEHRPAAEVAAGFLQQAGLRY